MSNLPAYHVNPETQALLETISREKLIAIIRTDSPESAIWASTQLYEAGFRIFEITLTVPEALRVMETLADRYPNAIIGAGTVLESVQAVDSLAAGAKFLVSPVLVEPLIQFAQERDILVLPGCMTPTEIWKALKLGADAIKFFPAQAAGGAEFISAVKGPFPHAPIIPTGGITLEHMPGYFKAGALAMGVGGPLLRKEWLAERNDTELQALATRYLQGRDRHSAPR